MGGQLTDSRLRVPYLIPTLSEGTEEIKIHQSHNELLRYHLKQSEKLGRIRLSLLNYLMYFNDPIEFDFIRVLPPKIRPAAKLLKISETEIFQLLIMNQYIHDLLDERKLKYEIDTDVSVDPEYTDWIQFKIIVKLKTNSNRVYEQIKSKIRNLAEKYLSDNLYEKVIIKIQSI